MWCYDAYFVTNTSLRRHIDVIREEIRFIATPMRIPKKYNFDFMQLCLFSVLNTFIVFAFNTPKVWPHMVMWREIWISLISNLAPIYLIEMRFSPEIIDFYVKNYYQIFNTSFLNFLSEAKFGLHIWRQNSSHMGGLSNIHELKRPV